MGYKTSRVITNKDRLIELPFDFIINHFLLFYADKFGVNKSIEIAMKIDKSKKIKRMIRKIRDGHLNPGDEGVITEVNSIPYFFFSKAETLAVGSIYTIKRWLIESQNDNWRLSYDLTRNCVVGSIFKAEKTKAHVGGNIPNFFPLFYDYVFEKFIEDI